MKTDDPFVPDSRFPVPGSPVSKSFLSASPSATFLLGRALGSALLSPGATGEATGVALALSGELGSGKTTFTKGLAAGLGVREETRVTSPTFVLKQEYRGRVSVQHYDAYRLSGPAEFLALGFDEDLACGAVVVVEWADRVAPALPDGTLWLEFQHDASDVPGTSAGDGGRRRIAFRGHHFWDALVDRAFAEAATTRENGR